MSILQEKTFKTIYTSFIYCSVVLFIVSFFMKDSVKLDINIASYSILASAIILVSCIIISKISVGFPNVSTLKYMMLMFNNCGPYLLMLSIIGYTLFLLINYKSNISEGHVSDGYYTFSNISTILILLQLYIVLNGINEGGYINKMQSSFVYLIGVINWICVITLYIILNNFNTDGFQTTIL
jgi:hypothetical protein